MKLKVDIMITNVIVLNSDFCKFFEENIKNKKKIKKEKMVWKLQGLPWMTGHLSNHDFVGAPS